MVPILNCNNWIHIHEKTELSCNPEVNCFFFAVKEIGPVPSKDMQIPVTP